VLTPHERPTGPEPLSAFHAFVPAHVKPACVWLRPRSSQSASASGAPDATSAKTEVSPARLVPIPRSNAHKRASRPLKSHR
jgi:hypothetical protein